MGCSVDPKELGPEVIVLPISDETWGTMMNMRIN
jgi:hypothetical protein